MPPARRLVHHSHPGGESGIILKEGFSGLLRLMNILMFQEVKSDEDGRDSKALSG